MPHYSPYLDTPIALQDLWMHTAKDLQVHRPFGQIGSIMAIKRFLLGQLTRLMMTSEFLQYIVNFYVLNL
jgi:hypothetical protein